MKITVAQIQRCKPGLGLPGNAEETLSVFTVVNQLQTLLLDLEKVRPSVPISSILILSNLGVFVLQKVPALFTQQPLNPAQSRAVTAEQTGSPPSPEPSQLEAEVGASPAACTLEKPASERVVPAGRDQRRSPGGRGPEAVWSHPADGAETSS